MIINYDRLWQEVNKRIRLALAGIGIDPLTGTGTLDPNYLPPGGNTGGGYTPATHAASHATGGSDPLTPGQIGAATAADITNAITTHTTAADPHAQYQRESEKGQPNGYAGLGADGIVPASQLPAGGGGSGDMSKATYDTDNDGVIDRAEAADVLRGWQNVKTHGAIGNGTADDTAAIQAAINAAAAAGGGVVYFPAGVYLVAGALQDTARGNAQILLPAINVYGGEQVTIRIRGESPPPQVPSLVGSVVTPDGGTVIKSTLNAGAGGAVIGGWGPSGTYENFSMVHVIIEDLTLRLPANPVLTGLNLSKIVANELRGVMVDTGSYDIPNVPQPTTATSYGVRLPENNNGAWTVLRDVNVIGFYTGMLIGEHTNADGIHTWACKYSFEVGQAHHAAHIKRCMSVHCQNGFRFTGGAHAIQIDQYDMEHWNPASGSRWYTPIYDVDDPNSYGKGSITWHAVLANVGTHNSFAKNGGANLQTARLGDTAAGGAATLDQLTDATITSPQDGQTLTYSAGQWINTTPSSTAGAAGEILIDDAGAVLTDDTDDYVYEA